MSKKQIIQALQNNETVYCKMPIEQQVKMKAMYDADVSCLEHVGHNGRWEVRGSLAPEKNVNITFRLRQNYEGTPEVAVKCEIESRDGILKFRHPTNGWTKLMYASQRPDFIGFLYATGIVSSLPRMYDIQGLGVRNFFAEDNSEFQVITPTHVLFGRTHVLFGRMKNE